MFRARILQTTVVCNGDVRILYFVNSTLIILVFFDLHRLTRSDWKKSFRRLWRR